MSSDSLVVDRNGRCLKRAKRNILVLKRTSVGRLTFANIVGVDAELSRVRIRLSMFRFPGV